MNGQQQQPHYQQNTQASALSYPTQEMGLDASQGQDRQQLLRNPIQETAPFVEHKPDEDLPPCHQQLNGADTNGVSSTSDREHAVEHPCSPQELQLWIQLSDRQADITSTTFPQEKNEANEIKLKLQAIKDKISKHDDSLFSENTGKLKTGLSCHHSFNNDKRYYVTSSIEKDVDRLIEDLDKAFVKYWGAYHIGSKSKTSEARKRKEQRKKIKEQEIVCFK